MALFTVRITETITKYSTVEIETDDWEMAEKLASDQWQNGLVEVDYENNFVEFQTEEE